jgi:PPK2 family polyphosphate:nucleotide phosphotransferase
MDVYRIDQGTKVILDDRMADDTGEFSSKSEAKKETGRLNEHLQDLQDLLWAEHQHRVLLVLQGMDASGKDSAVRHVFAGVNPAGVKVISFKAPTPEELAHDYLWRIHRHVPGDGEIAVFNRSHYEDVGVVRVKQLVPESVWRPRFEQINAFEKMLAEEGTIILKFFLHISKDEQRKQLQERLDDPTKRWKFNPGDLAERARWDDYMAAYGEAISTTSTPWAPWYVVPTNHRWYRDYVLSSVIVATLDGLKMSYPEPLEELEGVVVK